VKAIVSEQGRRKGRIEKAAELRQEGKGQREIAKELKISQTQVRKDLVVAGADLCAPKPKSGKVAGKDGKKYRTDQ
jgi:hypothetical protein